MKVGTYEDLYLHIERLLSRKERVCLAIDGGAASGKTTLAEELRARYGAAVVHMDDFFLRPEQRLPERFAEPGGNFDRERFFDEVVLHLSDAEGFRYRKFDCGTMSLGEYVQIPAAKLLVIEGSYSQHPLFCDRYDLRVFLSVSESRQRARILARNEALSEMFFSRWIPMEKAYFRAFCIDKNADIVIFV